MTREEIEADEREAARDDARRLLRDPQTGFGVIEDMYADEEPEDEEIEEFE
jgi:hypothetical protein